MNEQARRPFIKEAVLWTLWKHREIGRNDLFARKSGNRFDNNDPCMLRHTAGCSFDDIDEGKSSLIDLEAYDFAIAA